MHEILIKAYADGIVESLKSRNHYNTPDGPVDVFAAVDLGEDHIEDDIHSVSVKFWWERYQPVVGTIEGRLETTLHINVLSGKVDIGYTGEWDHITPRTIDSAADWIVQEALRAV